MIHYQLRCGAAHEFDAWFRDSAAYEEQAAAGLLECPQCGERQVARALMAPAVPRKARAARTLPDRPQQQQSTVPDPILRAPAGTPVPAPVADRMPDHLRAALQRLRAEVERRCDYVGPNFAEEARRIHNGESDARGIYGEATEEQAEALAEDGIEVSRIPWLPRADA